MGSKIRKPDYYYMATKNGKEVEKVVKGAQVQIDPLEARLKTIDLMMQRLYGKPLTVKELAAKNNLSPETVEDKLIKARKLGIPEIAREIFIREFLPASMAVLQEALHGSNLKLATTVALKVVAGLDIMEDPAKAEAAAAMEPESLEAWRVRFTKKAPTVEGMVVRQLPPASDDIENIGDLSVSAGRASRTIREMRHGHSDIDDPRFDVEGEVSSEDAEEECGEVEVDNE